MVVMASSTAVVERPEPAPDSDQAERFVLVSFDGRAQGRGAVRFAAEEAANSGDPLVVYRTRAGDNGGTAHPAVPPLSTHPDLARRSNGERGPLRVHRVWGTGDPVSGLLTLSRRASLLVLGRAGHAVDGRSGLGGTARRAAMAAPCTTVVVPSAVDGWAAGGDRVVVGLDGSAASFTAFEFAYRYASRQRLDLHVLHSRQGERTGRYAATGDPDADLTALTELVVDYWRDDSADITLTVVHTTDPADTALLDAAHSAQMLVVAARSEAPHLAGLGSVARRALEGARCPVAVVHGQ